MGYPPRTIVAEPFASQMETIERALIEVQSQPQSYYGRRNNNNIMAQSHGNSKPVNNSSNVANLNSHHHANLGMGHHNRPHQHQNSNFGQTQNYAGNKMGHSNINFPQNMKYSYYQHQQQQQQNQQQKQHSQSLGNVSNSQHQQSVDLFGGGYRNHQHSLMPRNSVSNTQQTSTSGLGNTAVSSGLHSSLGASNLTPQIPQVFHDENLFGNTIGSMGNSGNPSVSMDANLQDKLSAFDPFGSSGHGSLFSPIFSSSSPMLGSTYSSTTSNIWGNSNSKSMAGDAAVWG